MINLTYALGNKMLQEKIEDLELMLMAHKRLSNDTGETYSDEDVRSEFGITEKDLKGWKDIELD